MDQSQQDYLYDAFISYRRSDGAALATWLRRRLQDFVLPPGIAEGRGKLRLYLDMAFERANEDFWANNIVPGLRASRYLLVVATPNATLGLAEGQQNWVEREIELFLSLPQGRNVLVVRAKGEFQGRLPGQLGLRYPNISIIDMRAFSPLIDRVYMRTPLRDNLLTVLGTLHQVEATLMPTLRMEDARHARVSAMRLALIATGLVLLISGLAITAFVQRDHARANLVEAERQTSRANKQTGIALQETRIADDNAKKAKQQEDLAVLSAAEAARQRDVAKRNGTEARHQQVIAEENAATAQRNSRESRARELAAYANQSLNEDPERSILLAIEAVESTLRSGEPPVAAAEDVLHNAILASRVRLTLNGHSGSVNAVAFSRDGRRLASASSDGTTKIWDPVSGRELSSFPGSAAANDVAFSPDGNRLAIGYESKAVRILNLVSGLEVSINDQWGPIRSVEFGPDGKRLAVGMSGVAKIFDSITGREQDGELFSGFSEVNRVALSPDGKDLAIADHDGALIFSDARGRQVLQHNTQVNAIAFSPDGYRVATAGEEGAATIWDVPEGNEFIRLYGHSGSVKAVAFNPDSSRLAMASEDGTGIIWDAYKGNVLGTVRGHLGPVNAVTFSPDGRRVATGSADKSVKVWDAVNGEQLLTLRAGGRVDKVIFSPDGKILATAQVGDSITVATWDVATGGQLASEETFGAFAMAFSPDSQRLAFTCLAPNLDNLEMWNLASGKKWLIRTGHSDFVTGLAFSQDGRLLATTSKDGTAEVRDSFSGQTVQSLHGQLEEVEAVAFNPNGSRLATLSKDNTVRLWDVASGNELFNFRGNSQHLVGVAFTDSSQPLALAAGNAPMKIYDAISGYELVTLTGHSSFIPGWALSPDGKRLALVANNTLVRVWDTASGVERVTLQGHSERITDLAFAPDGKRLATAGEDGTVQIYAMEIHDVLNLARSRISRTPPLFTAAECQRYFSSETCPKVQ